MADTYLCPSCDSEVVVGRGCPKCRTPRKKRRAKMKVEPGFQSEDSFEDDFDYDDFIEREFGRKPHKKVGIAFHWWLTAVILLVVIAYLWI